MARNELSGNGGWMRVNTGIITRWKTIKGAGIGCSVPGTMAVNSSLNGFCMDFLHKGDWLWDIVNYR